MTKRKATAPAKEEIDPAAVTSASEDEENSSGDDDSCPEVSEEEEDLDDEDGVGYKEVNVDFEFFDPKEIDFLGLKALLTTYLDGQQYDSSGLVDTIIKQTSVGTVVKTAQDDDPLAIMTVLNTQTHAQAEFMKQIRAFISSKVADSTTQQQLLLAFDAPSTGLVLNERLINSPPSLAPPLLQFLLEEIQGAAEDEDDPPEVKAEFQFKQYLLLTRVFKDPDATTQARAAGSNGAGPSGTSSAGKRLKADAAAGKLALAGSQQLVIVYVRPEDEFLHQQATLSVCFPVEGRAVAPDELQPLRLLLLVAADKVPLACARMDEVVGNVAAGNGQRK